MSLLAGFELKEFNAASLSGTFQNLGTATLNPCYEAVISNESDVGCYISVDGTNNTFRLSPGQILPVKSYSRHFDNTEAAIVFKKGLQLRIKQVTAAGTGAIIVNLYTTR